MYRYIEGNLQTKTACGAPLRLALLMWESPLAASTSPLSPTSLVALRDWAALSSCLDPPAVELRPPMRPLAADPCDFRHTQAYFARVLLSAGQTPLHALPRHLAHETAAARLSGQHVTTVVHIAALAGLASPAVADLHHWLTSRWLTFAADLWQTWGKAQPPRPQTERDRARAGGGRPFSSRAYTATGRPARPERQDR